MQVPYNYGRPTGEAGVFALGGAGWEITWSPDQIHPYAAQWLHWSTRFGPPSAEAPEQDLWSYSFQTKPGAI